MFCLEPGKNGYKDLQDLAERKNFLEPGKKGYKDLQDPGYLYILPFLVQNKRNNKAAV